MKTIPRALVVGLAEPVVFGFILLLIAGTFDYWQAWVFLVVFAISGWIPGIYLLSTNPDALQRRTRGGPTAEPRVVQRVVMAGAWLSLAGMLALSALDHRFGWSSVPTAISLAGDVLVASGVGVMMLVIVQNSYAAATVQVEADQKLISNGLYRVVRHPMYAGNVMMMVGIPLALGSYWGLVFVMVGGTVLALRICDEEKLLRQELDGYSEYARRVRYRLVPYAW